MALRKRIAILGCGPVGLEAALYARALGHDVTIYDRGEVADNVRSWGYIQLFTPWSILHSPLGRAALREAGCPEPPADARPTGRQLREQYLLPLARGRRLDGCVQTRTQVIAVGKDDFGQTDAIGHPRRRESAFRILLRDAKGHERVDRADIALDCTGTYGNHRWAGRGGIPAPGEMALHDRIWYSIPDILGADRERFANRHTLVLGCGFSAATVIRDFEQLQRQFRRTRVSWAIRRPGQAMQAIHGDALPARRDLVLKALAMAENPPSWLQFLGTCVLEEISGSAGGFSATLRMMQTSLSIQVDEVAALVGYLPDSAIYEQLQIHECYATGTAMPLSADALTQPEPNFFILGAKSYGTNSNFLLNIGHKQVADAFRLIQNDPKLNLYGS